VVCPEVQDMNESDVNQKATQVLDTLFTTIQQQERQKIIAAMKQHAKKENSVILPGFLFAIGMIESGKF
jgi:hemerythrin superfamily protein